VGSVVVRELLERGIEVRAATRRPEAFPITGARPVPFDWRAKDAVDVAARGTAAAFVMLPEEGPPVGQDVAAFLARAKGLGLSRVVLLSAIGVEAGGEATGMIAAERALAEAGLEHVILRANTLAQIFTRGPDLAAMTERGELAAPTGGAAVSFVDAADVGRVAAAVLDGGAQRRSELLLTGPAALTFADVAAAASAALARRVAHLDIAPEVHASILSAAGLPAPVVALLGAFYASLRTGAHAAVHGDVATILGRPATPLADVLQRELGKPTSIS